MNLQSELTARIAEILGDYVGSGTIPDTHWLIHTGIVWIDGKWVVELSLQSKENYKEIKFFTYAKL